MAGHDPAFEAMMAIRAKHNHRAMLYFAVILFIQALSTCIFVFAPRWLRIHKHRPTLPRFCAATTRKHVPCLPSVGHMLHVAVYTIANVVLTFAPIDYTNMTTLSNIASRTGWLAMANVAVFVLFSMKINLFYFVGGFTYNRLNILHQLAGYMTIAHVIVHAASYSAYFVSDHRPERLLYKAEVYGMITGICFLSLGISGAYIRRWWYELFYYLHIAFWIIGVVTLGLHQPETGKGIIFITITCASLWVLDRLTRFLRLVVCSVSNEATLTPLTNGGTRVTLKKAPHGAEAGQHCFLWIPAVRRFEMHPFTIANVDSAEFVIASYNGFTKDLHEYAVSHPRAVVRASAEGPYASPRTPGSIDKLILIAGGSGGSFAFGRGKTHGFAPGPRSVKEIELIWIVRHHSQLNWFAREIADLAGQERVKIHLFVTRGPGVSPRGIDSLALSTTVSSQDGATDRAFADEDCKSTASSARSVDSEKEDLSTATDERDVPQIYGVSVTFGRPDVAGMLRSSIEDLGSDEAVTVMACGPGGLLRAVRDTTSSCTKPDGPSVSVHCEHFGW
ncbi:ferric reductase-like transmembrane component [Emericellopsis atlantica]|uniref:Ferric reductase-like transmembrane component n=1 Tax=Emericellopsis atlantica TaxID=2614577 RepID=A0A9P8CM81_9HYPO|nr:ferric reductase-like transmembrane component [Emericellopsis atlantica]KAG9251760.1 ferric reductase-like transmembrane component [Emericellopsis atlantica]